MVPRLMCLVSSTDDLSLLPALVDAGVDCFQVRDKTLSGRSLVRLTTVVLETGATVVVNDRADVALAAGAHGVHVGASDVDARDVRRFAAAGVDHIVLMPPNDAALPEYYAAAAEVGRLVGGR